VRRVNADAEPATEPGDAGPDADDEVADAARLIKGRGKEPSGDTTIGKTQSTQSSILPSSASRRRRVKETQISMHPNSTYIVKNGWLTDLVSAHR